MEDELNSKQTSLTNDERILFRLWLQRQFTERCKRNARYSLRAFAKSLKIDASSLSQILSGKRAISKNSIQALCARLTASPKDLKAFGLGKRGSNTSDVCYQVNLDTFAVISEWYHYAILELSDCQKISARS